MKKFLKYTGITLLILIALVMGIWQFYLKNQEISDAKTALPVDNFEYTLPPTVDEEDDENEEDDKDIEMIQVNKQEINLDYDADKVKLQALVSESERVNLVIFSHDGSRADTIILISFDPENQKLDIMNIPRDTYWRVEGYTDTVGKQKINAVYDRGNKLGGSKGMKEAIANLLQMPIHYFVKLDYDGAAAIIESLNGIEVTLERDFVYDDEYSEPPYHIDMKAGTHVLNGVDGVKYLRWRKNNDDYDGYKEGDLPRIERMQSFTKKVLKKSISPRLPSFIKTCLQHVYSDIELDLALSYAIKAIGMENEDITMRTLPGGVEGSYYVCDVKAVQQMFIEIYSN